MSERVYQTKPKPKFFLLFNEYLFWTSSLKLFGSSDSQKHLYDALL